MRISDWSSDVCSSDLPRTDTSAARGPDKALIPRGTALGPVAAAPAERNSNSRKPAMVQPTPQSPAMVQSTPQRSGMGDRKSVVSGKRVSVRVDLGGRRIITKKKTEITI